MSRSAQVASPPPCRVVCLALLSTLAVACTGNDAPAAPRAPASQQVAAEPDAPTAPATSKPAETAVSDDVTIERLLRARPDVAPGATCAITAPKWSPALRVALCSTPMADPAALRGPVVAVAEQREGTWQLTSTSVLELGEPQCDTVGGEPYPDDGRPSFTLDLAAYTIAPAIIAIGVRLTCHYEYPGSEGDETRLYLVEREGSALHQVFAAPIASSARDRVADEEIETRGVLVVEKSVHEGYFDLTLLTTRGEGAKGKRSRATFVRHGGRYEPVSGAKH